MHVLCGSTMRNHSGVDSLVVFGNIIFAAYRRLPNRQKGWSIQFSN